MTAEDRSEPAGAAGALVTGDLHDVRRREHRRPVARLAEYLTTQSGGTR